MSDKKIIAVLGATGAQGGGLVRAILADPSGGFAARAVTRNPDSPAARELAALGAEVVAGDADDEASLDRALAGAYGAYFVTFFWAHFSPEKELAQAKAFARAAKRANLQHVIWSTLEDTRRFYPLDDDRMPTLQGKYKVPHLDAKGEADQAFRDAGVPTTFLLTSFYWENFIHFGMGPRDAGEDAAVLALPMGEQRLSGIAAEDIGRCAYGIFKEGSDLAGQYVGIAGEHLTGREMAAKMGAALGREIRYQDVPLDVYRGLGFPGADDLGNMFQFYQEYAADFARSRPIERSRELNPGLQSFDAWLAANAERIPVG